jgi:hypothetical protein
MEDGDDEEGAKEVNDDNQRTTRVDKKRGGCVNSLLVGTCGERITSGQSGDCP